jgi:hypothetical protein
MLLTCQAVYGVERGDELSAFIEQVTGEPCPCRQGRACPMMPADEAAPEPVALPTPRTIRGEVGALRPLAAVALAAYGIPAAKAAAAVL